MILHQGTIKGCLPNTRKDSTKPNKGDTHSAAFEHESKKMETTCEFEKGGSNETSESCIKTLLSQSQLPTQQHNLGIPLVSRRRDRSSHSDRSGRRTCG